ncbi:amidohydrolase [Rhizobium cremeum]|uniref:amidohydrolase n=1 Tax=Rhizobium cremeum TaxID=2813827 RepID=UPI000DD60613|nr:amidohydrolase [Rhizobium cremeum]MCJ7993756.1 amidohydrolase [Rhizobium cremeum]MCJ7998813.1 amidohydrolase [Rhizobium cremeum]
MNRQRISEILPELVSIRHHLHEIAEIGLSEFQTTRYIGDILESWGFVLDRDYATTAIVATLQRGNGPTTVALRADMDALPILEETGLPYKSTTPGIMHACGHDGHSAMLLGAAYALSKSEDFDGRVVFIFQPAEENFGGAQIMIEQGFLRRYAIDYLFALHNLPALEAGRFSLRRGAMMASIDVVAVTIAGRGGHGALPEETADPIVAAATVIVALQSILSRNVSPHEAAVVTIGQIHAGSAATIIPDRVELEISLRAVRPEVHALLRRRIEEIVVAQAESFGTTASFDWKVGYPATINDDRAAEIARTAIRETFGSERLEERPCALMASEDCAFFLEKIPGAYVFIGNGDSKPLHNAQYDFNDDILLDGALFFCSVVEQALPK